MEDYPSNSYNSKQYQKEKSEPSKPKLEKVVSGKVLTKKKGEYRNLADIFISEDISNVKSYVLMDVLVPAIKKAISDIVTNGIDMILYGEAGRSKRSSPASKISYSNYYSRRSDDFPRENAHIKSNRTGLDYDDIIFDNRGDAEIVLSTMKEAIDRYGMVSVGDLYDLAEVSNDNYAIHNYGWTDLHTADVVRVRDGREYGYCLKLPRALPLK